jgi:two-component system, NarL family, sensor histidine kinase UhpB
MKFEDLFSSCRRAQTLLFAALGVALWVFMAPALAQTVTFNAAWQAPEMVPTPGYPTAAVKVEVPLPDTFANNEKQPAQAVWYRLNLSAAQRAQWPADVPLSLLLERVCGKLTVQLNGSTVLAGGPQAAGSPVRCGHPLLLPLPPPLWNAMGDQLIDIRLDGPGRWRVASAERVAFLSPVHLGTTAQLQGRFDAAYLAHVQLPQLVTIALTLVGVLVIVLGWWRRGDTHLVYFGLTAVLWGLLHARLWWPLGDTPHYDTELLVIALVPMTAFAAVQFLLCYAGWRSRPIEAAMLAQCLVVPATVLMLGPNRVAATAGFWYAVIVLELLLASAFFMHSLYKAKRSDFKAACVGAGVMTLGVLFEWAAQRGWLAPQWRVTVHALWPLIGFSMGIWLMYQQGQALDHAEVEQRSLESRLREATDAIERNYEQMAEMRVEKVTQQERKRIAADLHDDLGAKLLTIVHTSSDERISTLAREALEEMRLSVRGLTGKPVKLIDALGDWRAEVVSRLSQTGVEGDWQAPTEELPQTLSARAYVQTTRILREAVNNIIKHSGASRCAIKCLLLDGDFQLIIQDNGRGIPMEMDGKLDRGHGMTSMKHRAKQMQGQCLVESGPGYGTLIRLTLPLDKQLAA